MEALQITALNKHYDKFDLHDLSFTLQEGTITGFIGANGAGKTTTMKLIGGLAKPTSGTIKIFGKTLSEMTEDERQAFAVTFDEPTFPEKTRLTTLEKLLAGVFTQWESATFFKLLQQFGIDKRKRMNELSKGMKVKLNMAVALSHRAKLLILDEPSNGLDPMARDDFLGILATFVREQHGTVLVSSHIVSDLEKICSRFIFIHKGRSRFDGSEKSIKAKYEIANVPDNKLKLLKSLKGIVSTRMSPLTGHTEVLAKINTLPKNKLKVVKPSLEDIAIMLIHEGKEAAR